jgi:hypothetical protein
MPSIVNKFIDSSSFATATRVYDDIHLTTVSPDGYYQYNNEYRNQVNGLLGPLTICEECGLPCGGILNPPTGNEGIYQLEITAGSTSADTGAISIYFDPKSFPDGIRVLYDGVYYNRLSSPNDGNLQSTSGVADAFTILGDPNDNCVPSTPSTLNYVFKNGYDSNGWIDGTPSPQSITINTGDDIRFGQNQDNLLIVPKPNALPALVTIQVLGPCSGTGWDIAVQCPAALPSFQAKAIGAGNFCQATDTTLYFGRFLNAGNPFPILNNPVFLDHDGVNRASDQNYIMDNNQVITVTQGVVSSIQNCVGP